MEKEFTKLSDTYMKFFTACNELQKMCKKDASNDFKGYKYMSLPNLLKVTYEVMHKYNFMVFQTILLCKENLRNIIDTKLVSLDCPAFKRESHIVMHLPTDEIQSKAMSNMNQNVGASITYYRRYALCTILNIMPDDDLDGEVPENKTKKTGSTFKPATTKNNIPF